MSIPSFVAFNSFPNNTCQLFYTFPITYKIQPTSQARLYFPQQIFPNASQCCMRDIAYLLDKLKNGTWSYVNVSTLIRKLLIDDNGYLVTVEAYPQNFYRFDASEFLRNEQQVKKPG
jgi:hypothetical protein